MPTLTILAERPDSADALQLLKELDAQLNAMPYAAESRHAFSVEKLLRHGVAFFVTRQDGAPAGCGGVQLVGTAYAEVKRMFVRPQFRGQGLGKAMLEHLAAYSRQQGIPLLRLETGIYQTEAIGLYESFGFERVGPFGDYPDHPHSLFFEKPIS
jgi:ribosomal protein S18 acetylase RimI-like enzyme